MAGFDGPARNTDREIWRGLDEGCGSYYADSIHVTEGGGVGFNCGGTVVVLPLRKWHELGKNYIEAQNPIRQNVESDVTH
jgi:hypothetical protein